MNLLLIGNSFSEDAQRYIHKIAAKDNCILNTVNLYIGGCSLEMHYNNILGDKKAYEIQCNGENTGFYTTIEEALVNRPWDYIALQQVSHESIDFDSYEPYLTFLSDFIKKKCPKASIILHQTWAYKNESDRLTKELGYKNHREMFRDVEKAYMLAQKAINADGIIKSGELFNLLLDSGIDSIYRDQIHANFGIGRYALGLLWYGYLTGNDVIKNSFSDFDDIISEVEKYTVKNCVNSILNGASQNYNYCDYEI